MPKHLLPRKIHAGTHLQQDRIDVLKGALGVDDDRNQAEDGRKSDHRRAAAAESNQEDRIGENDRRREQGGEQHLVARADEFVTPEQKASEDTEYGGNGETSGDFEQRDAGQKKSVAVDQLLPKHHERAGGRREKEGTDPTR